MKTIELFQWDLNKQIPCSFPEAHFACVGSEDALIVKANGGNASVPNILLQEGKDIMVWMMEDGAVADSGRIRIITRAKPADYIYTETEVITFESLVAKVEDVIAKGNAATDSATTAAQKADAAANKANAASDKAAQVEAEIKASEARRVEAEQGRAEAEATRAANESKRTESFNTNLVSWNSKVDSACKKATDTASKAAQDAKTATDAAIAKNEEATNAAVAKADKATASATTAANKAEAAVSKLPLPLGNTLKGEVESTMVSVHDAYPAPLVTAKVMGQSNQITTTGKNLANGMEEICSSSDLPTNLQNYCWGYSLGQNPLKLNQPLKAGTYTFSYYADEMATIYFSQAPYNGTNEQFVINTKAIGETKNELNRYYGTVELKNDSDIIGIYSDYKKCCCGMLSEGTSLLPYEPYTGGKPSPSPENPQEITNLNKAELVITGKNLINADGAKKSGWNVLLPNTKLMNGATYVFTAPKCKQNCSIYATASDTRLVGFIGSGKTERFTVPSNADFSKGCFIAGGSADSLEDMNTVINTVMVEVGTAASGYSAPKKYALTTIDLKGNELCSLPNGVKDEVVIDAEGNVSLIKRVTKIQSDKLAELVYDVHPADVNGNLPYIVANFNDDNDFRTYEVRCNVRLTGNLKKDKSVYATWNALVVVDTRFTDVETAKQILKSENGIYYYEATPQTIPLGKVELPALPEATSNVWNDGNIPANVYINYLKDVNIAYSDLENQIKQITAALSVMDTPTVIPEMAWGTPAAI